MGNVKTFEVFFHDHYEKLCSKAYRYIHDSDVCEDIVQECFIKYWELSEQNKTIDKPLAYLSMAVKNSCLNYIKSQKTIQITEISNYISETEDYQDDIEHQKAEPNEIIEQALNLLPPKCREIFELSRIHNKTYKQIAEQLQISIKTVENQMGKAIRIIRKFVDTSPQLFTFLLFHFNILV